jgi:hypothetical protein
MLGLTFKEVVKELVTKQNPEGINGRTWDLLMVMAEQIEANRLAIQELQKDFKRLATLYANHRHYFDEEIASGFTQGPESHLT